MYTWCLTPSIVISKPSRLSHFRITDTDTLTVPSQSWSRDTVPVPGFEIRREPLLQPINSPRPNNRTAKKPPNRKPVVRFWIVVPKPSNCQTSQPTVLTDPLHSTVTSLCRTKRPAHIVRTCFTDFYWGDMKTEIGRDGRTGSVSLALQRTVGRERRNAVSRSRNVADASHDSRRCLALFRPSAAMYTLDAISTKAQI